MESDGRSADRAAGSKAKSSGFVWVSPSPSPAEVERLESAFPEVVCVPGVELEAEMAGWQSSAIIARSFTRWVPAAAYLREFRRAGVQGEITPISLAFKCHIFRFEDPKVSDSLLNRPWIINGQIIGMEQWRPEFIPAEDAISSAMVWVRLPNLPMEFWKPEFLRMILQSAGQFVCIDASTMAKSRGGFARVCIRVDLRRPLRPGTRIQGVSRPFWQQFAYESLEGLCSSCGTLHLAGPCSASSRVAEEEAENAQVFGPWIAALRLRRADPAGPRLERRKQESMLSSGVSGNGGSTQLPQAASRRGAADAEGWRSPVKIARRRVPESSKVIVLPGSPSARAVPVLQRGVASAESVPGESQRAGSEFSKEGEFESEMKGSKESEIAHPMQIVSPFASLDSGLDAGGHKVCRDACPGPLKRPRAVDSPVPRTISKSENRKGKGRKSVPKCAGVSLTYSDSFPLASCFQAGGKKTDNSGSDKASDSTLKGPSGEPQSSNPGSSLMIQSIQSNALDSDVIGQKSGGLMTSEDGSTSNISLSDIAMGEGQGGAQVSPSCK